MVSPSLCCLYTYLHSSIVILIEYINIRATNELYNLHSSIVILIVIVLTPYKIIFINLHSSIVILIEVTFLIYESSNMQFTF